MGTQYTIKRLTGAIGAEVKGINLNHSLDDETFSTIHQAFLDHCMLVFRGQFLTRNADDFRASLGASAGRALSEANRNARPPRHAGRAQSGQGKVVYDRSLAYGFVFHAWSAQALTMLMAQVLPEAGGDTMFASRSRAYETLSEGMKHILEGLRGLHGGGKLAGLFGIPDTAPRQSHPIVRTHPESGRRALYVNPLYTQSIEGLTEAESRGLLDFLFQQSCRPDFTYRHQWALGDVVMWDNRCALHYAVHDHGAAPRVMHRTVVAGDIPR